MSNDSNTTQRDELAKLISSRHTMAAADAILAAGYRKPRTITTVEELNALPAGSVIRADNGEVFEKQTDGPYCDGPHDWQSMEGTFWNGETFVYPAAVLHEPEAELAEVASRMANDTGARHTLEDVAAEFGIDECNGSGRCEVSKHVHGCYSDLGRCDEPAEHEATR